MPEFIFTFPMTSPSGKPPPTQANLDSVHKKPLEGLLKLADPSAKVTSLRFFTDAAGKNMVIVEGTANNMPLLRAGADEAEVNGLAPMSGWITDGPPEFVDVAPDDIAGDPEAEKDEDPSGGRRRRRKRSRKATRRHRKRRGTRKL